MSIEVVRFTKLVALCLLLLASIVTHAAEATAFALIKEGNRFIGEQAKDKVVQIRSEKSIGGLVPTIWYVVYYDPTATFKAVEVKFGAGQMMDVKRPFRVLESVKGEQKVLEADKIKIDSDKAIEIACKEPILEKLTLKATSAKLERGSEGSPVWKIRIWAAKMQKPQEQADLGEVILSAENGTVIKNGLNINKVD